MQNDDFAAYQNRLRGGGNDLNPYGVGRRRYGAGRDAPNYGVSDKTGYRTRDAYAQLRMAAMKKRLKAMQSGDLMSSGYMSPPPNKDM